MKYLHRTAGIVTAFCLMTVLFIASAEAVAYWTPGCSEKEYAKCNVLDSLPPITMDSLFHVTDEMMDYLRGDRDDFHATTTMSGKQREFSNEREIVHMEGVQVPSLKALSIRRTCLVPDAGLLTFVTVTRARTGWAFLPSLCIGTGLLFGLVIILGLITSADFTKYFTLFHHTSFTSDLWILDPTTDMLIDIVPEGFFMDMTTHTALLFGSLSLILFGVCLLLIMRNRRKEG